MCTLSMIYDYGRQVWPQQPYVPNPSPGTVPTFTVPKVPTPEEWAAFLELVEKARKFDEMTNQPDCEDPEKGKWMEEVERRLADLEAKK
jgi:hypothetical protein